MRCVLFLVAMVLFTGCSHGPPSGVFDVQSSTGERLIGHCTNDPRSTEVLAYGQRIKNLKEATSNASRVPGFRAVSIKRPAYQYVLYAPALERSPPYHITCPLSGAKNSCILSAGYPHGVVEAWVPVDSLPQTDAAAKAAVGACYR
jgi:hypothetical protein